MTDSNFAIQYLSDLSSGNPKPIQYRIRNLFLLVAAVFLNYCRIIINTNFFESPKSSVQIEL